jgi:hypothetical protein
MFRVNNVVVSGNHKINYFGLWIPVCNCPKRELLGDYDEPYLYCLNTTSKRIFVNGMEFSDWDEIFEQDTLGLSQPPFLSAPSDNDTPFTEGSDWEDNANLLSGEIRAALLLSRQSKDQMFPRGSTSARCGQIVNLEDSPGTDSITYAGMKR